MIGALIFLGVVCYVLVLGLNEQENRINQLEQRIRNLETRQ